jgi:hypothetical protein
LNSKSSGTGITDAADNALTSGFTGQTYSIDRTAPQVEITSRHHAINQTTKATSVTYGVLFSEDVTGVDADDFFLVTSKVSGMIGTVSGSGKHYQVTVNNITGDGTMQLSVNIDATGIQDAATNNLIASSYVKMPYFFDHTAPSVQSINRHNPLDAATTATTLVYRVSFSEAVDGVGTSDFTLSATSPSTGTVASLVPVAGSSGRQYDVTVQVTNGGGGTLRLDLESSATGIKDLAGNGVNGGFTSGETYTLGVPPGFVNFPANATFNADAGKCSAAESFSFRRRVPPRQR